MGPHSRTSGVWRSGRVEFEGRADGCKKLEGACRSSKKLKIRSKKWKKARRLRRKLPGSKMAASAERIQIDKPNNEEGKKTHAKCRALIILKLKTFHHPEVADKNTAKEIWPELELLYKNLVSNSKIAQLKIALHNLKVEGNEKVVKYIARTRAIPFELRAARKPANEMIWPSMSQMDWQGRNVENNSTKWMIPVKKERTSPSEDLSKTLPKRGEEILEKCKLPKHFWGNAV
jgi:antitoxin component of RelBE/YafQ-DinJ toxin-antitoxin module